MSKTQKSIDTKARLLEAAQSVLLEQGYAGLSTRRVADVLGTPMSQIQYHFGSKEGMILALFESMNDRLLHRQSALFDDTSLSVSQQWDRACDYLEQDLDSGYVRILQELITAGWSNPAIREVVAEALDGWQEVLTRAAERAEAVVGPIGPLPAREVAALVAVAFLGAEGQILLGRDGAATPIRAALRRVGDAIRAAEARQGGG